MKVDRATSMLLADFAYVLEATYRQQHVRGVTVAGLATNQVQAWVGPPLATSLPAMLQDPELGFAKWEYTFASLDPAACTRCNQEQVAGMPNSLVPSEAAPAPAQTASRV